MSMEMRTVTETLCGHCGAVLKMEPCGENRVRGICTSVTCPYDGRAVVAFNLPPVELAVEMEELPAETEGGLELAFDFPDEGDVVEV